MLNAMLMWYLAVKYDLLGSKVALLLSTSKFFVFFEVTLSGSRVPGYIRDKLLTVHYCSKEVNIKFQLLESRINTPSRSYNQVKANKPWIWCPLDCFLQDGRRSFPGKGVVQRQNKVTESSIRTRIDTNCAEFVWRIALFSFLFLVEHVASWIQKGTSLFSRKAIPSFVI